MKEKKEISEWKDDLKFSCLPDYARFILDKKIEEYGKRMLSISRKMDIPILRYFSGISDEQLIAMGIERNRETFKLLSQNKAQEVIEGSTKSWIANQLPMVQRDQVVAEDIILVSFIRRKVLRDILPEYTADVGLFLKVMEELDRFTMIQDSTLLNVFIKIQQEKINEANTALKKRENELLEAQEIGQIGSFEWDLSGKNSVYTPQLFKIFEFEKTTGLESFIEDVHPEDRERVAEAMSRAIKEGTLNCEYRYQRNNKKKVILSRGKTTYNGTTPVKLVGTVMDVTERSEIVEKLQQSEQLHKQAQALTHIGNWSWSVNEDKVNWSDEMYRIYGLEPQAELITLERFLSFVHADDKEKRLQEIQEALAFGVVKDYNFRIITPDGVQKVLRGKGGVTKDQDGKSVGLVGTCQDITKEFILNKELEEREVYLNQLLSNAPDAIIVIDEESKIILWNPKTELIFGWNTEEVIGRNLSEVIIPQQYRESHLNGMKRLLKTGQSRILNKTIEIEALHKNGGEFYISLTISKSVQADRPIFISFIRDITQDRIIQAELAAKTQQLASLNHSLQQTNIELIKSNKELESFNFIASHDLQEPLRKIKIFGDRILNDPKRSSLPENTQEYTLKMHLAAERMQKLIDDFLAFSRTVAAPKNFETVGALSLLDEVKNELAETISEKGAIIEISDLPVIEVIPFQFRQLFINLILNSIKYCKEGVVPHILVTSSLLSGKDIDFEGAIADKDYVRFSVNDNGIGFEQQYAVRIFDLFQRLHSKENYSGTGIGLSICKKIVENHNGFIIAQGIPGKGATFNIYLPVSR